MTPSKELQSLLRYVRDTGLPHRVTSAYRAGDPGFHGRMGTGGWGLAFDLGGPTPCPNGCRALHKLFRAFIPVEHHLAELIYSGASYSIKHGRQTEVGYGNGAVIASHWNHVHVAVPPGVFVSELVNRPVTRRQAGHWLYPPLYLPRSASA